MSEVREDFSEEQIEFVGLRNAVGAIRDYQTSEEPEHKHTRHIAASR